MNWNQRYLQGDTPWDKGSAAPPLLDLLSMRSALFPTHKNVLVPGCGAGYDVEAIASHGCQVTGLDIAPEAIARANKDSSHPNTDWQLGDFFDPSLSNENRYHTIWEHTCFCAIPPERRVDYVQAAWNLLEPNGKLIGVFFLNTGNPAGVGPPFSVDRSELKDLFGEHFSLEWEAPPQNCYPGREEREWLMIWRKLASCLETGGQSKAIC